MRNNNNYNPYKFILFIPLAVIAGLIYYIISSWQMLNNSTLIILIVVILLAIAFLGYEIGKENHPLRGMKHEKGAVEDIIQKIIEQKKGVMSDQELMELRLKTNEIFNSSYRRAERTMRLKLLIDEYLKDRKAASNKYNKG